MKQYKITVNGTTYDVAVEELGPSETAFVKMPPAAIPAVAPAAPAAVAPPAPAAPAPAPVPVAKIAGGTEVNAPIPGSILEIKVKVGDTVKSGDVLCILEAMKMENDIAAPCDGKLAAIQTSQGASVDTGDLLFVLA